MDSFLVKLGPWKKALRAPRPDSPQIQPNTPVDTPGRQGLRDALYARCIGHRCESFRRGVAR